MATNKVKEWMKLSENKLATLYPIHERKSIIRWLFAHFISVPEHIWRADPTFEISEAAQDKIETSLFRLLTGEPIQYVLGEAPFYGRSFIVKPGVLIPRGETEELVHWILNELPPQPIQHIKVLDIGTGSGCIAVTLKKECEKRNLPINMYANDISSQALQIAKENGKKWDAEVNWFQWDIFDAVSVPIQGLQFDIIVSNPPYVPEKEREEMAIHVKAHEPPLALFVPNREPLTYYRRILELAPILLNNNGCVYVEIHEEFYQELIQLFESYQMKDIQLKKDLNGKWRMLKAFRSIRN